MSVVEEIAWGDGSGDKIYLTADAFGGNQTILVSSDANAGVARTKTVTFSATGVTPVVLTVSQEAGVIITPVFHDYLAFDGTAYIDTDIEPVEDFSIAFQFGYETLLSAQRVFGVPATEAGVNVILSSATDSINRTVNAYYGSSSASVSKQLPQYYVSASGFLTPNIFGWGDASYTFTKGVGVPNGAITIGHHSSYSGQPYTGAFGIIRIYGSDAQNATTYADLTENYTPINTLRPCTYGGVAGLWNVEESKFYGNSAGSGTLVACERLSYNISSYDSTNYSYYSIANPENAYAGYSNTTYAQINLTRGSQATSYVYFKFDTSSIPANATIVGVFCSAKISSSTTGNPVPTRQIRMYSGTSAKGTATTITSTSATMYRLDAGTWTRAELNDARIRLYAKRGTSNVNTNYYYRFYGATLYVLYTE